MADETPTIECEVAYARPERQCIVRLQLRLGTTANEALLRSGLLEKYPEIVPESVVLGVYGEIVTAGYIVQEGDRVEVYRPLTSDPRTARRERVKTARRVKWP